MSLILIAPKRDMKPWKQTFQEVDPSLKVEIYPDISDKDEVEAGVLWHHPMGALNEFPNLKWVSSLGAGVDHILKDKSIAEGIRVTRILDQGIGNQIARMIVTMLADFEKNVFHYLEDKKNKTWNPSLEVTKLKIGIMGMGEIGKKVADVLSMLGYSVSGLSFSGKAYKDINIYDITQLDSFLESNNTFVCLLPFTEQTKNLINKDFFDKIPEGSYIMNLARGQILNEDALIQAIASKRVRKAYLDVFETEPLPGEHPFWQVPEIIITPHISGITDVHTAVKQIVSNYHTFESSGNLQFEIDRIKGY